MSEDKDDLFKRLSDDELRAAGIDPGNIEPDDEPEGPFRLYRTGGTPCPKCGDQQHIYRLGIVNLATGKRTIDEWFHRDRWTATLWCGAMNDGWVSGLSAIQREHFESVRRRTPRSTNAFFDEKFALDAATPGSLKAVHFTERDYGNKVAIGITREGGTQSGIVMSKDDAVRVAKAILARWPEPIEDAPPAS